MTEIALYCHPVAFPDTPSHSIQEAHAVREAPTAAAAIRAAMLDGQVSGAEAEQLYIRFSEEIALCQSGRDEDIRQCTIRTTEQIADLRHELVGLYRTLGIAATRLPSSWIVETLGRRSESVLYPSLPGMGLRSSPAR